MNRYYIVFLVLLAILQASAQPAYAAVRKYSLTIAEKEVHVGKLKAVGMTINGRIPGPILYFDKGDLARIRVHNEMSVPTSIHWHGVLVPPGMDGVPFVSQVPIQPGATFTYEFPVRQTGTYWYHSHSELQEQSGLYGSIVISDSNHLTDRDHVLLLSDWTTERPAYVLRTLKRGSEWYALEKGASQSIFGAVKAGRLGDYFKRELQRMPPMDLADVAYDYFLSNGMPETTLDARQGETVRLRIINGSATTYFHLNYAGGPMTIITTDGQPVQPVNKISFLIGVAETYDVILKVPDVGSYEFRATAHDGSGYTSSWLGTGKRHPVVSIPKPNLYIPMGNGGMTSIFALTPAGTMGMPDSAVDADIFDKPGMSPTMTMDMPQNDMAHAMDMSRKNMQLTMTNTMEGMQPATEQMPPGTGMLQAPPAKPAKHIGSARPFGTNFGLLETDISSRENLAREGSPERPGTPYPQLKAVQVTTLPNDAPVRKIRLTLDGDMKRYTWFINNKAISENDRIRIKAGEVVRFIMINRTMMHHPMHLHGHFFRVLNGQGDYAPLKHTVDVAPMSTTVIEFYGNEVGDWFFHCHLLYHMKSGMARFVHYQGFDAGSNVMAARNLLLNDPLYFYGTADVRNSMTSGDLILTNTRWAFTADWEVGWQNVDATDWEGLVAAAYHLNRFTSFFGGVNFSGEGSSSDYSRGVLGLRYLLPLNFEFSTWVDTDSGGRFMLEKEFQLTPRIALHGEAEYDTHEQCEGKADLSYTISRDFSALAGWHSDYGWGVGVQVRF